MPEKDTDLGVGLLGSKSLSMALASSEVRREAETDHLVPELGVESCGSSQRFIVARATIAAPQSR
jgi:hypothetical protein